jgi:hypothetical protein
MITRSTIDIWVWHIIDDQQHTVPTDNNIYTYVLYSSWLGLSALLVVPP